MRSIFILLAMQLPLLFSCANTESNDLPPAESDTDNFSFMMVYLKTSWLQFKAS